MPKRSDALFAWESYIRANPQQAIQEIARQYGVTFAPNSPTSQQEIPDTVRPILDQFGRLNQELNSLKTDWQRSQEERIASELTSLLQGQALFRESQGADGPVNECWSSD